MTPGRDQTRRFVVAAVPALVLPRAARAHQAAPPVIGWLHSGAPEQNRARLGALLEGLAEGGFVDGKNVAIEYRWAAGHSDRLPALAAELIGRRATLIATPGSTPATVVAKKATATAPIAMTAR